MSTYTPSVKFAELDPFGTASSGQESKTVTEETSVHQGNSNTQLQDATVFVDDANVVIRDESHVAHIDNTILSLSDTNFDEQSIKTFLSRPIIIRQANFSTTDTYSTFIASSMPYTALQSANAVIWREKLAGIFGIRMDMRFRIVVNANRFQQGRYIMSWTPLAGPITSISLLKEFWINQSHMATLVQRTTVPHVEIDLCNDTVAELLVPFVSTKSFYPLTSILSSVDSGSLGFLNIYPYSPLVSPAGAITAGYTVYLSFENIRLFGAASAQSGLKMKKKHFDPQRSEISNTGDGPISSVSSALSKGFKEFANIPLLSTYANSISWVADRVTSVASVFGWSKPIAGDSMSKMQILQAPNHNTVDGDSDARPFSYLSKPGVVALDGISGTDYDEMDFSYIVRKPAWFQTMTWPSTALAGDNLTNGIFFVSPNTQVTLGGAFNYQPVAFVASFFKVWRGSLRYRFKFVRTEFHSGRVSIAFFPSNAITTYAGNAAYVHRQIVDIRESPEIEIVVPYINENPWTTNYTGEIIVSVVDPLSAPATVSSSITILCEISGGEDFEVAMPRRGINLCPTSIVPQSGLPNENSLIAMNIGASTTVADPVISSSITIGDKVSSFRAFLKRFTPLRQNNNSTTGTLLLNDATVAMWADVIPYVPPTLPENYWRADHYSLVASCYAIVRGGVRIRNVINKNLLQGTSTTPYGPGMATAFAIDDQNSSVNTFIFSQPATILEPDVGAHVVYQDLANNGVITIESPQYTLTYSKSKCDLALPQTVHNISTGPQTSLSQQTIWFSVPQSSVISAPEIQGQQLHNLHRSLADDANFGLFISVPPMLSSGPSSNPRTTLY